MWRRSLDVTGCTVILLFVWILLAGYADSQELPTRDTGWDFGINQRNLFYENNRIPDGLQVAPYLFVNKTKKYFFLVDSTIERLEITVSPCASPIIWQVSFRRWKDKSDPRTDYDENDVKGFNSVVNTNDILYTLSGDVAETLRVDSPKVGLYTVEITSIKTDSYVQILASSSPQVDRFPQLPRDSNVSGLEVKSKSFAVVWNPSPDERHIGNDIEYCVAVNKKRSFKTLCSVEAHLSGDTKPTLPPGVGFGFRKDAYRRRLLRQNAKPIKPARRGSISLTCVGLSKKFVFTKIKRGKSYYVDVFVKNKRTGQSRQYKGTYVKTKRKRKLPLLKNGKTKMITFNRKKKIRWYSFRVKKSTKDAHLAISFCHGSIRVEVKGKNGTVYKSKIRSKVLTLNRSISEPESKIKSKILTVKDLEPGTYTIVLTKQVRSKRFVYLSVTTKSRKFRVPQLPENTALKVYSNFQHCNKITIALLGTDIKQNYCIYKTQVPISKISNPFARRDSHLCNAISRKDRAQKIMCQKHRNKVVLLFTVTGLTPNTQYIFDVFVQKGKYSFLYNSVRTKTKTQCHPPT